MICHTHWDREWYLTREEFRTKLVRLIDGLLEIIDTVPEYVSFMLDGQTIAIEDYLEIKPYNRERLFEALKTGKIISGPWYILPDELLISGESHIRNYMKGTEVVRETGRKMEIAYLPDSFGHPAQMPQIVEGLGMNTMVFWRGVPKAVSQSEFYWESPFSGAKIFCVHLPFGYGNSANLDADLDVTAPRIQEITESLGAASSADLVLLMNGSDHIVAQGDICEIVKQLNGRLQGCRIELSTLERYLGELKEKTEALPVFTGEFRSGERSMLLGGTLSARMYLKQRNDCVQNKMERYLEPVLAIEKLCGGSYDSRGYRDYIWKKILENHPHDSICGCSIDEVHSEMMTRYGCVEQLEDTLLGDAVVRSTSRREKGRAGRCAELFLFEPSHSGLPSYIEADVLLDQMLVQEVLFAKSLISDYEKEIDHPALPDGLSVSDETGREIPHVILSAEKDYTTLYQDHTAPEIYKTNKIRVGLLLPGYSFGCHQISVKPSEIPSPRTKRTSQKWIENEYYRLSAEDGMLRLFDKKTQTVHDHFARLTDGGDAGDEYTYSWPAHDEEYTADFGCMTVKKETQGEILESLLLSGNLQLPAGLSTDRASRSREMVLCPVSMKFTLVRGIDRIDGSIEFDNQAKDHRLQVELPAGFRTENSESYQTFDLTQHPVSAEIPQEWMEYPQAAHPTHGYIALRSEGRGMSVGVKGLAEYEARQLERETAIRITLLRCVGWLSRTDLLTRRGNGGWTIETPEGQCPGKHTFDFCVTYHDGNTEESFALIEKFRYPAYLASMRAGTENAWLSKEAGAMMKALPQGIQISALKPSEDETGIVLRIFSIAGEKKEIVLPVPEIVKRVCTANLAEESRRELAQENGCVRFSISPKQIVTLFLEL